MMKLIFASFLLFLSRGLMAQYADIIVAKEGGDYATISEAIEHLPMFNYERKVILIKNGVYEEKIRIEQDYVTLIGESRDSTIIRYSQLRSDWQEKKDEIGPAVINIHADDVILENLTIENSQPEIGPHAFTIYGKGTRTILNNCTVLSKGGDTVSLWDFKDGMYYHTNCHFEGAVDFVCPRGWCYISNSTFFEVKKTATLWHAGAEDERQKFVVRNSSFDGVEGFELGRHHYEAQFYLIDCAYSKNMADKPIYRVTYPDQPERDRPYVWGERKYFMGVEKQGRKFDWLADNLQNSDSLTSEWTFDGRWSPEDMNPPKCLKYEWKDGDLVLTFDQKMTVRDDLQLTSSSGQAFQFKNGRGRKMLTFSSETEIKVLKQLKVTDGELVACGATVIERAVKEISFTTL